MVEIHATPCSNIKESIEIREKSKIAKANTFMVFVQKSIQYSDNEVQDVQIMAAEHSYQDIKSFEILEGRYFSTYESNSGKSIAIIGYDIANQLFEQENPIGKTIKIEGKKITVVGVFNKEGKSLFDNSLDKQVLVPINYMRNIVNLRSDNLGPLIMVEPKPGHTADELKDELAGIMRALRRLKPIEEEDFALNQASLISKGFDSIFIIVDITGIIIGGFSILVGGFGIANIMFVSVKEQTRLIGIQKALGAKRYFILLQFLFEAIILSLIGGIIGLLLVYIGTIVLGKISEMGFYMSTSNIISGVLLSVTIGIISGIIPALQASKLDPVTAMASS